MGVPRTAAKEQMLFSKMNPLPKINTSASSSECWTRCTAAPRYVQANADKLPPKDTVFSSEGVTAAEVAAAFLEGRAVIAENCDKNFPADATMRYNAFRYADYVRQFLESDGKLIVEKKLPLWYAQGRNAYVDSAVANRRALHVFEYKYGVGVPVYPKGNRQLAIYAYAIGLESYTGFLPPEFPVTVHVIQPRCPANDETAAWETTWGEICDIANLVSKSATVAISGEGAVFAPSDKACQWCPAKGFCEARKQPLKPIMDIVEVQPDGRPGGFPPAATLTQEQIANVVRWGDDFKKWITSVCKYAEECQVAGPRNPFLTLKVGRAGNRFWMDEAGAEGELRSLVKDVTSIYEPSVLKGVKPIEDMIGKKLFEEKMAKFVGRPPGSPKLVFKGQTEGEAE